MVTFIVGKKGSKVEFQVHKSHATFYSPVFKSTLNNEKFPEDVTQTYYIDDYSPACFTLFIDWIYSQNFELYLPDRDILETIDDEGIRNATKKKLEEQEFDLAQLWILGQKYLIPSLQNAAMDAFAELHEDRLSVNGTWYHYAYENTDDGSKLREFAIVRTTRHRPDFADYWEYFPKQMIIDLLETMKYDFYELVRKDCLNCRKYFVEELEEDSRDSTRSVTLSVSPRPAVRIRRVSSLENDQVFSPEDDGDSNRSRSSSPVINRVLSHEHL